MSGYRVTVVTGDVMAAGTDANVSIILHGSKGSSPALDLRNEENRFERGKVDVFWFALDDLGDIDRVTIWHDNKHDPHVPGGPAWYLHAVFVRREDQNREWAFPCARWLARDEDDRQTRRELAAVASHPPAPPKIVSFTASNTHLGRGDSCTLAWEVTNCGPETHGRITLEAENESGLPDRAPGQTSVAPSSSLAVRPDRSTRYVLSARNDGCTASPSWPGEPSRASLTITVHGPMSETVPLGV
jgi:hypothetical protein